MLVRFGGSPGPFRIFSRWSSDNIGRPNRDSAAPASTDRTLSLISGGNSPSIQASGGSRLTTAAHISFRWLIGAVLTGVCGVALIGSALYLGLDRQSNFAEAPEIAASAAPRGRAGRPASIPAKATGWCGLSTSSPPSRRSRRPTTIRVGDKEVVKARAFTHVATTLTLTPTGFADAVPEFNPLKLTAGRPNSPTRAPDPGPVAGRRRSRLLDARPDERRRGCADGRTDASPKRRRRSSNSIHAAAVAGAKAPLPLPPQMLLMRTSRAGLDPSGGLAYATTGNVERQCAFLFDRSADGARKRHQCGAQPKPPTGNRAPSASCWCAMARRSRTFCAPTAPPRTRSPPSSPPSAPRTANSRSRKGKRSSCNMTSRRRPARPRRSGAFRSIRTNSSRRRSPSTTPAPMCR